MKGMKVTLCPKAGVAIALLLGIGAFGCNKNSGGNNAPGQPEAAANNATNTAPIDANIAAANNAPPVASAAENNSPTTNPGTSKNAPVDPKAPPKPAAKPAFVEPAATGQASWTKKAVNAKKLAESVDAKMKSVTNTRMHMFLNVDLPTVGRGFFEDDCMIADQSRFLTNYAVFVPGPHASFETYLVRKIKGDKGYSTFDGGKYHLGRTEPDKDILKGWVTNSTHYLSAGIGTSHKPFTELVDAAQKAKWTVAVEDKKFASGAYRRIIMESPTLPKQRFEIVIHPEKLLPVSFFAVILDKKKTLSSLELTWAKSDKPLTDADLSPKKTVTPINAISPEEAARKGLKPSN